MSDEIIQKENLNNFNGNEQEKKEILTEKNLIDLEDEKITENENKNSDFKIENQEILENNVEILENNVEVLENNVEVLDNNVEILEKNEKNNEINEINNENHQMNSDINKDNLEINKGSLEIVKDLSDNNEEILVKNEDSSFKIKHDNLIVPNEDEDENKKKKLFKELNQKIVDEQKINNELISKLHIQLDNVICEKEESMRKLKEKENDLKQVEKIVENLKAKLEGVETTNSKLKALAIKLKKELAEVSNGNKDEFKKQIENYNNLKKDYDKIKCLLDEVLNKFLDDKSIVNISEDNESVNSSEKILEKLNLFLNKTTNDLNELKSSKIVLEEKLKKAENDIKVKEDEFTAYKIKVTRVLKDDKKDLNNENLNEINKLKVQINKNFNELSNLREKLNDENEIKESLKNELLSLKDELIKTKNENDELKTVIQNSIKKELELENEKELIVEKNDIDQAFEEQKDSNLNVEIQNTDLSKNEISEKKELIIDNELDEKDIEILKEKSQSDKDDYNSESSFNQESENDEILNIEDEIINIEDGIKIKNALDEILNDCEGDQKLKNELLFKNELLKESESENCLLSEQNRVLKSEVRRLERAIERGGELAGNLEYLKNILIKFFDTFTSSSNNNWQQQLVPVLKTILKLTNEEEAIIRNFIEISNKLKLSSSDKKY